MSMLHKPVLRTAVAIQRVNHGRGHSYKVDGRRVPGVTTIIDNTLPKPALIKWAAKVVAEAVADAGMDDLEAWRRLGRDELVAALCAKPNVTSGRAAMRGTDIHRLAERIVHGEAIELTDDQEHLRGHLEACVAFMNDWRPAPVLVEGVVADRTWGYAGTFDLVADLPDARRCLFDYKTGGRIYQETALQLAAYRHAGSYLDAEKVERSTKDLGITAAYAVHLRADGYDVVPVQTGDEVFEMFTQLALIYNRLELMKDWIGDVEQWAAVAA